MADIGMSAFAMFFMQCDSFLDFQRKVATQRHRSNLHTLFGVKAIPTDPHIRSMLDEVEPEALQDGFDGAIETLRKSGGLSAFSRLDGRLLVALDGTEYFCSKNVKCEGCLTRKRRDKTVDYYHSMLCASVVAPGESRCVHLMPEFIENPDGNDKQDCERNAVKRWLRSDKVKSVVGDRPVFLGDALFGCQPVMDEIAKIEGAGFIFVVKPDFHKALFRAIEQADVQQLSVSGLKGEVTTYRWAPQVSIRGDEPMLVDFCEITITNAKGRVTYRNSFATNMAVNQDNVAEIIRCGRTRWKIENESFNVLKNHGYNLARNFGHGENHLAKTLVAMNLLAFSFRTVCDVVDELWTQARKKAGKRTAFFNEIVAICNYHVFETWDELTTSVISGNLPARSASP